MVKTIFYLKSDKENKHGENPIFCKINYRKTSTTLSTGKWISKKRWQSTNHLRNVLKLKKEKTIQVVLNQISNDIENAYIELSSKKNINITASEIKALLKGELKTNPEVTFYEVYIFHKNYFDKKVKFKERSRATQQKYNRAAELFLKFIKLKYKKADIPITDITNPMVYEFESFLRYESKYKGKIGIDNNSAVKYIQRLSTIFNHGVKRELIHKNPLRNYDGKIVTKDAVYLTDAELRAIEQKEFSTFRLSRIKDIFLFSCYTGYAPIEVVNLKEENLVKDNEGTLWIDTNRMKTGVKSNVPLLPRAQRIIEKYSGFNGNYLIPTLTSQKMNEYLKEIADLCGIKKNLTHYVARHTFATTVTLGNGLSIETVSSMMGHTNLKMTQHYAKILDKNVKKDMSKLTEKFS
ncbi:site-specific integrase [Gramella sp. KN1008]|uniref:site-specific integrase n=1 Tax=Gramella sp. KN1008 TaxID=2529298 RepID=UPI00104074F7|nr:site-specific integrase [Gramella sp. KN1008]TBW28273.1 site-specific integrase [Gramella sp. KN1008]